MLFSELFINNLWLFNILHSKQFWEKSPTLTIFWVGIWYDKDRIESATPAVLLLLRVYFLPWECVHQTVA
jgi:hypothetical protein